MNARMCSLLDCMAGTVFVGAGLAAAASGSGAMVWLPLALGLLSLALVIAAEDRVGPGRLLPGFARHDIALSSATFLALSPWLLAFADVVWRPHLIAGQVGIGVAIVTRMMADLREAPPAWAATLARRPAPPVPPRPPAPRPYASGGSCGPRRGPG